MNSQNTSSKIAVIYLSGAGLHPNIWDGVRAKTTLPSEALAYNREKSKTLEAAVQDVLAQMQKLHAAQYVIVAHSLGGIVGVQLAHKLGERMAAFIAVSATIPAPGKSFVDTLPFPQRILMPVLLKIAGTKPPVAAIRKGLCNDLTEQQTTEIITSFTPEPIDLYTRKTSASAFPASKYLYIRTLNDQQVGPAQQTHMAEQLPAAQIVDIASGHLAMLSHPDELTSIINRFTADV